MAGWCVALALHAPVLAQPQPPPLALAPLAEAPAWIRPDGVARFALSRAVDPADGHLAVLVGDTDWSGLAESAGTLLQLKPAGIGFAPGEHPVVVYLVDAAQQWREVGRTTLRVLTGSGFEKAVATPTLEVGLNGQAALHRTPEQPPTDRDTYQDLSVRLGLATTHVRGGWTATSDVRAVGVNERTQALRFGELQDEAPLVDLGSYQVGLRSQFVSLAAGHNTFGTHRLLLNGFASRGLSGTARLGPVVDLSLAAINGTTVVGYGNLLGVGAADHRILNATVGLELVPARRGALRVAASLVDGSVLPQTNLNQAAVRDPEESRGVGVQVQASDAASRFVLDAGLARSRFVNPVDLTLPAGLGVTPVLETTRQARYLDVSYALVQGARLGETALATVTAGLRHSRVDPLYRSVSLPVRADVEQNAVDLTAALGAFTSRATYEQGRDNLAELASVLTTRSRQLLWSSVLPLQVFAGSASTGAAWPSLSYELMRVHQYGDGLPTGGLFDSLSQVPDQVSLNQTAGLTWQGPAWRGGYTWNRSLQDNRQPGRERADLLNQVHTVSLGAMVSTVLDAGLDLALEKAANQELARDDRTRRASLNVLLRPAARTTLAAVLTRNWIDDQPRTSERRTTDVNLTVTQGVALVPRHPDRLQGQFFLRYVRQTIRGLAVGLLAPDETQFWTLNTGLTFRLF
ncbi:MAG: hypothetical protein R2708_05290 [Vicinamibacterales bacterium]